MYVYIQMLCFNASYSECMPCACGAMGLHVTHVDVPISERSRNHMRERGRERASEGGREGGRAGVGAGVRACAHACEQVSEGANE